MSLELMKRRLEYRGGARKTDRMIADKLNSLRHSINHSYQTVTIETKNGNLFNCLLNPDNLKVDYDMKILSIPYQCIDLNDTQKQTTTEGLIDIGLQAGDVFTWVEDESKWIIYMQYKQERAYFRAECRKCEGIAEFDGNEYPIYVRGPVETKIDWLEKNNRNINEPNYSLNVFITKDELTTEYFHRFKKVKVDGFPYEVQAIDWYCGDGIIELVLLEDYRTTIAEAAEAYEVPPQPQETNIEGKTSIRPYDVTTYKIDTQVPGYWKIDNKKARIIKETPTFVTIEVMTGKSGEFDISYLYEDDVIDTIHVTIDKM
jgi:hypothetical protein